MNYGLEGKSALVAAGSKGIGLAIAQGLAAEGVRVSICSRKQDSVDAALEIIPNAIGFAADVSNAGDIEKWIRHSQDQLGPIQILITNTGGPPAGPLSAMTDEQWQSGFDSTLMNIIRMVRLVQPDMTKGGWGRVVHVTSLVAKEPSPLLPISSTLRAGIMALTRLQATEMAAQGVTVNGVLPGHTLTDRQVHLAEIIAEREGITAEQALENRAKDSPMRRIGKPEEIAAAALFFCSIGASYVTGTSLLVDGGASQTLG